MSIQWTGPRHFRQDPRDPTFYTQPYVLYDELHQRPGPVYWEDYGMWCLSGFDAVDSALRDRRFARLAPPDPETGKRGYTAYPERLSDFAKAEAWSLLALEPPQHTRLRRLVNRAFVSRQVDTLAPGIESLAHSCVDRMQAMHQESGQAVDLLKHYATPIPVIVIARLLGVPESLADSLLDWSHAMVKVYTMTQSEEDDRLANQAARDFRACLLDLIQKRRRQPSDDLLSHLVSPHSAPGSSQAPDELSDDEIVSTAILLLNAGHEATVHQLGNLVNTLLSLEAGGRGWPPDLGARLSQQQTADNLISEALRYVAPLHLFTRYAQEDVALHSDVQLQCGEQVALLLGAANRDPARFRDAHRFDPDRDDGDQVTFGAGLHFCIGAALARLELRIAMRVLHDRLPSLRLAQTSMPRDSYHFHGLGTLPVLF